MTSAERQALLGDDVLAHLDTQVDAAPEPPTEVVETLRRIFTLPLGTQPASCEQPAGSQADAA